MPTLHALCAALADAYRRHDAACEAEDLHQEAMAAIEIDAARTQLAHLSWSSMSEARRHEVMGKIQLLTKGHSART